MKTYLVMIASLLFLIGADASAKNSRHDSYKQKNQLSAYSCYDVDDRPIHGIWNQRDAWLVDMVGGSCVERGPDEADLGNLLERSLTERQVRKALRKARKRFPGLLKNAWLVGARDVHNSSFKYIKYKLVYNNLATGKTISVKIKQNKWSGKIKKIRARTIQNRRDYSFRERSRSRDW